MDPVQESAGRHPHHDRYAEVIRHGTMSAGLYAPHESDDQEPHDQDEVYVVVDGSGVLPHRRRTPAVRSRRPAVRPGRRGSPFEDFTPNFSVWVVFYGPTGGESEAD
jgi:hypothetical protein